MDVDGAREVIEPLVTEAELFLEDIVVSSVGNRRLVKVIIDLPADQVGAVDLDAIAELSREVAAALDDADALGQSPYVLEVTSPGVSRPLTERRHWQRARTRLVTVKRNDADDITGRVVDVSDEGPTLEIDGAEQTIAWSAIRKAKIQVEFSKQ